MSTEYIGIALNMKIQRNYLIWYNFGDFNVDLTKKSQTFTIKDLTSTNVWLKYLDYVLV